MKNEVPTGQIAGDARCYVLRRDRTTRVLFVCDGISDGDTFASYWRKPSGSLARFKTPRLPLRVSRSQAQADLDAYAKAHRLPDWFGKSEAY